MVMVILPLLAACLLLSQTSATITYNDVEKTEPIVVQTYADQAAQNIRAIARSYMHSLMLKDKFSDYFVAVYDEYDSIGEKNDDGEDITMEDTATWYAQTYWVHTAAIGIGLVVSLTLFLSFFFWWICCCCCNKSQKTTRGMSCWRMTWGVLALILLALNVAGIAIGAISLQNTSTMDKKMNDTIDNLSEGAVKYLNGTETQVRAIQSGPVTDLLGVLKPLVTNVISDSVTEITTNTTLVTSKTGIVNTLNNLDTTVGEASTAVDSLLTDITSLETILTSLNTNFTDCKTAITNCQTDDTGAVQTACGNVDTTQFAAFDTADLQKDKITEAKGTITTISTIDSKTLTQWATEVDKMWSDVHKTVNDSSASFIQEYADMINEIDTQVTDAMDNTLYPEIAKMSDNITEQAKAAKESMQENFNFYTAAFLMNVTDADHPNIDPMLIESKDFVGYGMIALVALVGGLLLLLFLNILCGLSGIIFGCCKVSDDVPPTDRDSGTCGTMLMCTSYCSVFLCAVATFVAAILLTVVMMQEGVCREYSKDTLLASAQNLTERYGFNITAEVEKATDIKIAGIQEIMNGCKEGETVFKVLGLTKDSLIVGQNISQLEEEMLAKISSENITSQIDGINFSFVILDADTETTLKNNKANLSPINYTETAAKLDDPNSDLPSGNDLTTLIESLESIKNNNAASAATKENVGQCATRLRFLQDTTNAQITSIKGDVKTTMLSMTPITEDAGNGIDYLVANATKLTEDLFTSGYVKSVIKDKVTTAVDSTKVDIQGFITYIFTQLETTIGSCQPLYAVYATALNYTCDGVFIHFSLMWASLSLIGISLLLYMCVARCLARYFIKFPYTHPSDDTLSTTNIIKNDWNNGYEMSSPMSNRVIYPDKLEIAVL